SIRAIAAAAREADLGGRGASGKALYDGLLVGDRRAADRAGPGRFSETALSSHDQPGGDSVGDAAGGVLPDQSGRCDPREFGGERLVLTNPLDLDLLDSLQRASRSDQKLRLYVASPATLAPLLGIPQRPADHLP